MRVVCVQTKERKYRKALEKKVDLTGLSSHPVLLKILLIECTWDLL